MKICGMTAKAVLCRFLLEGRVLNVRNCHREIGYTNIAREIPRMVEHSFEVIVSRTKRTGKDRYGNPCNWTDYRLNSSDHNLIGIEKMKEYVNKQWGDKPAKNPVGRPADKVPEIKNPPKTLF